MSKERLCRHRLMGTLNDGVIGGTTFARKAHPDAQSQQPHMQPRWKRRGSRIIIEDRAVVQRERSSQGQLAVRQTRIRRYHVCVAFNLEATDDIDHADQTDLTYPIYPHDALCVHLPFLMWAAQWDSGWLDQVMMGLRAARQASLFEQTRDACSTRQRLISPIGIRLECS